MEIKMDRQDWIILVKNAVRVAGQIVDIVPLMKLMDALMKAGVTSEELE